MGLSFGALFLWTLGEGRTHHPFPPAQRRAAVFGFAFGAVVYLVAIGIAFVSAPASLGLIGLVALYYVFERTPAPGPPG